MSKRRRKSTPIPKPRTWTKTTIPMAANHTWKAPEGYKIFVADRGLVSFNIPADWYLHSIEPIEIRDSEPPDEKCRLMATIFRTPPGIDWTELPLIPLMENATKDTQREVLDKTPIQTMPREDIEVVWFQLKFMDPEEHRPAFSRISMARGKGAHVLFTFDYWIEDAEKFEPVWDEVMRSLLMDRVIADPTRGEIHH